MPASVQRQGKILVVDDQPLNVEVLEELLEDHQVETAYSGQEALDKLEWYTPDLILLDVMMPRMSGLEVCRKVRATPRLSSVAIVFLSAKATKEDVEAGISAGANDYVTKPFHHFEILVKVEEYLAQGAK